MPLDLKRLQRDVDALRLSDAAEDRTRVKPSGAMAMVRAHLGEIERLKTEGATWVAIAAALARQGVRLRDGRPITGRHLTGLIDSIRRQDAGRMTATARRASRADVSAEPPPVQRRSGDQTPSAPRPADTPQAEPEASSPRHRTAEQMRRESLADLYEMLEGKKP